MRILTFLFASSFSVSPVLNCLVTSGCPCGDILDLAYNPKDMLYTKQIGCVRNVFCPIHYTTSVYSRMNESEIPQSLDVFPGEETFVFKTTMNYDSPGPAIDIFSYFGMVCENNAWSVTKYPLGVSYFDYNAKSLTIGSSNEYNGKKSKIYNFVW
ncbi:unnamed protein product [Caenorhabditis brenneri]